MISRATAWMRREQIPLAIAMSGFVARFLVAGWNSYWYDEVLSVWWFGVQHATLGSALRLFAENSIHPPLYQSVLYYWMRTFGDTEVATRTLSNLYVAVATLALYALVKRLWGRRVALFTIIGFSVMHVPTYYGLETRSYAQTMMLATVSSYCLLVLMQKIGEGDARGLHRAPAMWGLLAANTGLFFTHYYNAFFVAAQAVFAAAFLMWRYPARRWPAVLSLAGLFYLIPPGLLVLAWRRQMLDSIERFSGPYEVTSPEDLTNPLDLLRTSVLELNLSLSSIVGVVTLVAVGVMTVTAFIRLLRLRGRGRESTEVWGVLYLGAWMVLPLLAAHLGFILAGIARYHPRYFIFCVPALVPMIFIMIVKVAHLVGSWRRWLATGVEIALSLVLVGFLFPGGYAAATTVKHGHDWRGIVLDVGDVIRGDQEHSYVIFEATTGLRRLTDYYFGRFGPQLAVDTISRHEENLHEYRLINDYGGLVREHDFLIVVFPHTSTREFPGLVEELGVRYVEHHRQINSQGRGFIIYDVRSDT